LISGTISRSKTANICLEYQRNNITEDNLKWIASFPVFRKKDDLAMVHGGWINPIDEYLIKPSAEYFEALPNRFFASGHTHKQLSNKFKSKNYCNPGSIGQPRDGDKRAAFAIFDGKEFELKRVNYDVEEICNLMQQAGFNEYHYNRLRYGAEHFV
jgi:predicted phosphodiesterase